MEYLLIVNRFNPKSVTRLTAGLASTAMRRILCISFSQVRAIAFWGWEGRSLFLRERVFGNKRDRFNFLYFLKKHPQSLYNHSTPFQFECHC
jgi:hypothetical protein